MFFRKKKIRIFLLLAGPMKKTKYENIIPYIIPKVLSINTPSICLSISELKIFLILLRKNRDIKKIIVIAIGATLKSYEYKVLFL